MIKQVFKTSCDNCGGEATSVVADMTGENEITLDFLDGDDLTCTNCGARTYIYISKELDEGE